MRSVPPIRGHASQQLGLVDGETLSAPSSAVVDALRDFENRFVNNAMTFTVEAAVRDFIRQKLSDHHDEEVCLYGAPVEIGNDYKKPYARGLAQRATTDAVASEVNVGHSSHFDSILEDIGEDSAIVEFETDENGSGNRSLDIAVLRDDAAEHPVVAHADELAVEPQEYPDRAIEVAIAGGSKYFPPEALDIAIEVKYVKDKTTPGTIHKTGIWEKVDSDYQKLSQITDQLSDPPESHLVIVTNYDPFRMAPHCDETDEENKSRDEVHSGSSYPEKFVKFVTKCACDRIHVWTYHPAKIYRDGTRV